MSIDLGQMQQEQGRKTLNMTLKKGLKMTLKKGGNKLHNINLLSGWDDTQLKEDMDLDFLLMLYRNDEVTGVEGQVVYFDNLKENGVLYTKDKSIYSRSPSMYLQTFLLLGIKMLLAFYALNPLFLLSDTVNYLVMKYLYAYPHKEIASIALSISYVLGLR